MELLHCTLQNEDDQEAWLAKFCFDKASISIIRSGSDAKILDVNEQTCKSLGYTRSELRRMSLFDIDAAISPESLDDLWQKLRQNNVYTFETVHRRKDGSTFPVEISSNLLRYGSKEYSVSFVRDISEKKNVEKQRALMETHLRQAQRLEALGTLAGGIAHDFNNILSAINGYSELALMSCAKDCDNRKYLDQIRASSERAKNLVQQILAFSRQSQSEKRPVDIAWVTKEVMKMIRATLPSTIEIKQDVKSNLGAVLADETQIHQILMNLCTNAGHAMLDAGGLLRVGLDEVTINPHDTGNYMSLSPGRYVRLLVADTGHGIDRDNITRIFDPYFTTKKTGEGTGLGLSIVHGIVKDHGGDIKVYSEPGKGTTFQVFLPLAEPVCDPSINVNASLPSGKERILFVDDEKVLLEMGREMLQSLGYQAETKASAIDAIEAFQQQPQQYDLVISDMTMPKMTGDQLAKKIKEIRPDIPIIICSGFSARLSDRALAEIGIDLVLMKPVTLCDMANAVRKSLDAKKA